MVKIMPDKIASGITYCTSGGLVCNGVLSWYERIYHLDWNFIGLVTGVLLGVATFAVNAYYKRRDDARRENASRDEAEQQRIRTAALESYLKRSPSHDEAKAPDVVETVNNALKLAEKK
ncbi:class II holin family protein [Pantoea dispersa]|uniref:class II holin family protein n=1 Tax=Pantoea dispersa TaxID=59814 RepID=UPI000FDA7FAA|nr:class II holin family protein [Pantoea dispersa]MDR6298256.1 hypothetical protein [Pantoea dispersa]RVU75164.1 holin [Pantoea dispersa]